ncbi:MAG TPA: DUF4258 domain-containing protein [Candidatus Brocadiia bacterium]
MTDHAFLKAFKEGVSINDILHTILNGEIIENYPDRSRCLIYCLLPSYVPLHVVVGYEWGEEIDIVTVYIPDKRQWIKGRIRKKRIK